MRKEQLAENVFLYCGDSAELLPAIKRAHKIDAVVTDPPYGIGADTNPISTGTKYLHGAGWDKERPPEALIKSIVDLNKPTIIWGGNYFIDWLVPKTKWLVWDKGTEDFSMADAELAWCSFDGAIRRIMLSRGPRCRTARSIRRRSP